MSEKKKRRGSTFGDTLRVMFMGGRAAKLNLLEEEQMQSPARQMFRNFRERKTAMLGVWIFVIILLCCFIIPIFKPLDTTFQDPSQQNISPGMTMLSVPSQLKNNAKQISPGAYFGAGIDNNGNLYLWGNLSDRLRYMPKNMGKIAQVSSGLDHVVALTEAGELYSWGYDRLGVTDIPDAALAANIVQIFAGYQISAAVDDQGHVYIWGNESIISLSTRAVQDNVEKIVLNPNTGFVITKDKEVVCLSTVADSPFLNIPEAVQGRAVDIATTDKSAAVLTDDGVIHVWGSPDYGVMEVPEGIQGKVAELEAGRGHYTVRLNDGTVESWGWNFYGQSDAPNLSNVATISSDYYQNYAIDQNGKVTTWGLKGYVLGSDQYGRDILTRMITGGRVTLTIGAISVIIAGFVGIIIGGVSGYYGGKVDMFLMRFAEVVNAVPFLPLALILSALVGNRVSEVGRMAIIMVILGLLSWPSLARMVRAQILAEREKEFVTAAKALGVREMKIIFRHILPNVITVALVNLTLSFALCMLQEATLSYLGFGVSEPNATWGNMLYGTNNSTVMANYWWRWVFPALALSLTTIAINMAGDGMRDAIDPKSEER